MSAGFYRTAAWRRLRAEVIRRQPICATPGCRAASVIADHVIPRRDGGADALHNLRGLCVSCHNDRVGGREPRGWADVNGRPMDPRHWWNRENLSQREGETGRGEPSAVSSDPDRLRGRR